MLISCIDACPPVLRPILCYIWCVYLCFRYRKYLVISDPAGVVSAAMSLLFILPGAEIDALLIHFCMACRMPAFSSIAVRFGVFSGEIPLQFSWKSRLCNFYDTYMRAFYFRPFEAAWRRIQSYVFQPKNDTKYIGKDKEKDFGSLDESSSFEIAGSNCRIPGPPNVLLKKSCHRGPHSRSRWMKSVKEQAVNWTATAVRSPVVVEWKVLKGKH